MTDVHGQPSHGRRTEQSPRDTLVLHLCATDSSIDQEKCQQKMRSLRDHPSGFGSVMPMMTSSTRIFSCSIGLPLSTEVRQGR
ncbi:hypothetical protein VTK73DRAFT_755 [Phialemonium thermophilum]|uniref:Uncharacterized protein n=1 Tax=Phialemonium thermophilum TaxID=223376 RepID=A0ABR3VUD4_9PEZI